jgi:hypothetical protein
VNEKAGSAYAFQIASVSLANVEIPVTLAAKSIQRRGNIEHQIDELLTYANQYVESDVVCMDEGGSTVAEYMSVSKITVSTSFPVCEGVCPLS